MLGIIMKFDISIRLTPQVTTIICHHIKKIIKRKQRKEIQENMETKAKYIY